MVEKKDDGVLYKSINGMRLFRSLCAMVCWLGWLLDTVGWWSLDLSSAQITEAHMDAYVRDDLE